MNNSTTYEDNVLEGMAILATFETTVVVIAILIIVTSSLVVKNIYDKTNRTRADSMFILLSISDIGVGVLSMTALGVSYGHFGKLLYFYYYHFSIVPLAITDFCYNFPYTFSSILTTVIAIDRLFFITWQTSYKHIITEMRLKRIVALLFVISIGAGCVSVYYNLPDRCCDIVHIIRWIWTGIMIVSLTAVIFAYMRIIIFVRKGSKTMLVYEHSNSKSNRRLSTTIFLILICQVICLVPYIILHFLLVLGIFRPYVIAEPWVIMLRNCQCFCNGLIWLNNKKTNARKCKTFPLGKKDKAVESCL